MEILIAVLCFLVIYLGQTVIYRKYWDQGLSLDLDFDDRYLEIDNYKSKDAASYNFTCEVFHSEILAVPGK